MFDMHATPLLDDLVLNIAGNKDIESLNEHFVTFLERHGVGAVVGHALPFGSSPVKGHWHPVICTFPNEISEYYTKFRCADHDPFMERAMVAGIPVKYSEEKETFIFSPIQKKLFEKIKSSGFDEGLAVVVFARPGMMAYFGLAFAEKRNIPLSERRILQAACQQYFIAYRDATNELKNDLMTPRESQIMVGILNGKSNSVIAAHLGISEHTVDTHIRRLFSKLNANNRIEAALKVVGSTPLTDQLRKAA